MKITEEMYVRTLDGISKIIELRDKGVMKRFVNEDGNVYFLHDILGKPSYKIIDLIGVGDYVNGEKVIALRKDINERDIHPGSKDCNIFTFNTIAEGWYYGIEDEDIKSIVTKEQFEREAYKIQKDE